MLNISVNPTTGLAKLSLATAIKAGGGVPVTVTFTSNPGTNPVIELALGPQSSTPAVKAYLAEFEAQSSTVYTGTLDANDTRLITYMAGKSATTLDCEVVVTVGTAERQVFPNFPVTVQPPMISGPESSEGGPNYLTEAQSDARYLAIDGASGAARISADGLEIKDTATNAWRLVTFVNGELSFTEL